MARRTWIGWSLAALLLVGVVAGVWLEDRLNVAADPVSSRADGEHKLPRFDCDDRSSTIPYVIPAERREKHVEWMADNLEMTPDQVERMTTVFNDASFRADEFWRQTRDSYCELRDRLYLDVRAVLDDQQEQRLEAELREHEHSKTAKRAGQRGQEASSSDSAKRP